MLIVLSVAAAAAFVVVAYARLRQDSPETSHVSSSTSSQRWLYGSG